MKAMQGAAGRVFSYPTSSSISSTRFPPRIRLLLPALLAGLLLPSLSCSEERPQVVVYCALDRGFSEPILKEFEARTGIEVKAEYDLEASKTVGLVRRIEEEDRTRTRCDVFWNNEIIHTLLLKRQGLLEPFPTDAAEGLPETFVDPEGYWYGFAARARVFIVNSQLLDDPAARPTSIRDLVDPKFRGQGTMARPVSGTTLTHVAALFAAWGEEEAMAFLDGLEENEALLVDSNGAVMRRVRDGDVAFGLTDTDDYNVARTSGYPVTQVYPDAGEGELGTLLIPNTVCIVKNAPHRAEAEQLIEFLLSPWVEQALAHSDSAQIPLRDEVPAPDHVLRAGEIRTMDVDYEAVADAWERHREALEARYIKR